ncbi:EGF domain-specific O-linked N-acetylglucosamine transferase [Senna tora]|uniref:EGF domain-specific O-linked N-acetylglucosamine transferase n=1 Tax=Senna tora TaxID=362788 RepID=A0A834STU3_9FABA|nr:EGF domain-specific O-linked N-acetylglucosamine transferase [Senna tora]
MVAIIKRVRWSKSAICFAVLVFVFVAQITLLTDVNIWRVELRHVLSLSQWDSSGQITCNRSHKDFDLCIINGSTLLDPTLSTLFALGLHNWIQPQFSMKIRPYPLKYDKSAMSLVKDFTLTSAPPKTTCDVTHNSPALVFSAAGYTGNFFHEINENFIPLFITVHSLYPNQDVVLVITESSPWWHKKYAELLSSFTRHPIISINNSTVTHCFSSAAVGLIKHGPVIIDPKLLPTPTTLVDFHAFLRNTYMKDETPLYSNFSGTRPSLTLVSRRGNVSRLILNQDEIIKEAEKVGFNVRLLEASRDTSMAHGYKLVHTSHALLGVHGAGLTHLLFLRPGSILMQVVPIGLSWASRTYYEKPCRVLGLEYMEYKVEANESSLLDKYGSESLVVKKPEIFQQGNWSSKRVYLKEQNVRLDVIRFREYLKKTYEKAKSFMDRETIRETILAR